MTIHTLNAKQLAILRTVLRFRYVTADSLAKDRGITHTSAYSALEILSTHGYLGKLHDKSYRLQNKSARYYLTLKGLDYLRDKADEPISDSARNNRRRDSSKSIELIDQQVAIYAAYVDLNSRIGNRVTILVAADMATDEDIIRPLPSLYVVPQAKHHFFIELTDGQHLFLVKKRIRNYIKHYESDEWEWGTYPTVCIIRSSAADRTRLRKYIETQMENSYLDKDDFVFVVTSSVENIGRSKQGVDK